MKQEKLDKIYEVMASEYDDYYIQKWIVKSKTWKYPVMIWDILDYIDKELFRKTTEIDWMYEIDIPARERCVISLYNYFIWRHNLPIDKQDDQCIDYVFDLIK